MHALIELVRGLSAFLAELCVPLVQLVAIVILLVSVVESVRGYIRGEKRVGAVLARGLSLSLEFLLAGELLHIVVADDWMDMLVLVMGVVIHILLTVLLHREAAAESDEASKKS